MRQIGVPKPRQPTRCAQLPNCLPMPAGAEGCPDTQMGSPANWTRLVPSGRPRSLLSIWPGGWLAHASMGSSPTPWSGVCQKVDCGSAASYSSTSSPKDQAWRERGPVGAGQPFPADESCAPNLRCEGERHHESGRRGPCMAWLASLRD